MSAHMRLIRRVPAGGPLAAGLATLALALSALPQAAHAAPYRRLPRHHDSWFMELDPPRAGLAGLPATSAPYPAPGSANIWDTDLFEDSNTSHGQTLGIPTGASPVVAAIHRAGHYSICYIEAGAFQAGYPDDRDFAPADYGRRARRYRMPGYPNEWWFDLRGFRGYAPGRPGTLVGAARNIAAGLARRIAWCKLEGQDAVDPDDVGSYSDRGATGAPGAGWGLTQADAAGFERWLAYTAHRDGLAVMQKNDPANAAVDARLFDGVVTEECNYYRDPCAGHGGDW